ncbi:MAG: hypothetical protein AAB610_03115 [Patescibacteria group bacterium]
MKKFSKNVEDATEKELLSWVNQLDYRVVHLASDELTRRSIRRLNESIDKQTLQVEKSSEVEKKFTIALFLLSVVQLLVALFQLVLSFAYSDNLQQKILGIVMSIAAVAVLVYFSSKIFPNKKKG